MKRTDGECYQVISTRGSHGLCISTAASESFESTIEAINTAVSRSRKLGYNNDEKWLIVLVQHSREWTDDDVFIRDTVFRKAVALYDNGTVTEFPSEEI